MAEPSENNIPVEEAVEGLSGFKGEPSNTTSIVESSSRELSLDFSDRDLSILEEPTARQLRRSVLRVQLLRLAQRGLKAKQAAQALNIPESQALTHYRDPLFQKEVMLRVSTVFSGSDNEFASRALTLHEKIQQQAEKSFDELARLLQEDVLPTSLKVKVHQDFLNRSEESQPMTKVTHSGMPFDAEKLAIAAVAAEEIRASMEGKLVVLPERKVG